MNKGWSGERQRHAMSARGVSTRANVKFLGEDVDWNAFKKRTRVNKIDNIQPISIGTLDYIMNYVMPKQKERHFFDLIQSKKARNQIGYEGGVFYFLRPISKSTKGGTKIEYIKMYIFEGTAPFTLRKNDIFTGILSYKEEERKRTYQLTESDKTPRMTRVVGMTRDKNTPPTFWISIGAEYEFQEETK